MRRTFGSLLLLAFALSLLAIPANALQFLSTVGDPPLLGPGFPISAAPNDQGAPVVVYNATADEYLVVWQDARNGVANYDIYGQRVSATGALLGGNFIIAASDGGQLSPTVTWNATANEYLVVWTDVNGDFDIYAQRVAANGGLLGDNLAVSTAPYHQMTSAVTWNDAAHEYLVVWDDGRNSTSTESQTDIYGQRLRPDGSLLGSALAIIRAPYDQNSADVIWNTAASEYLIMLQDRRFGGPRIVGRRLTADGTPVGAEIAMPALSSSQYSPAIALNRHANEYLITWTDDHYGLGPYNIYGQRVDSTGALVGSLLDITAQSYDHSAPVVAFDSLTHEYLVAWSDCGSGHPCGDVYAQRISEGGALVGPEIPIAVGPNEQSVPGLSWNSQRNEHLIVWREYLADTRFDIYGQRMSGFGTTETPSPTTTSTATATSTGVPSPTGTATPTVTPTATLAATPTPTGTPTAISNGPKLAFLPLMMSFPTPTPTPTTTRTVTPSPTRTPTTTITPMCTATATRTPPSEPAGIYGRVTYRSAAAPGVLLYLYFWNGSEWSEKARTLTNGGVVINE